MVNTLANLAPELRRLCHPMVLIDEGGQLRFNFHLEYALLLEPCAVPADCGILGELLLRYFPIDLLWVDGRPLFGRFLHLELLPGVLKQHESRSKLPDYAPFLWNAYSWINQFPPEIHYIGITPPPR